MRICHDYLIPMAEHFATCCATARDVYRMRLAQRIYENTRAMHIARITDPRNGADIRYALRFTAAKLCGELMRCVRGQQGRSRVRARARASAARKLRKNLAGPFAGARYYLLAPCGNPA